MRIRAPRILDASAIVDLFHGHETLIQLVRAAEAGRVHLLLPTTCIAEAEEQLRAGHPGWEGVLLLPGVRSLPLSEHTAIEVGSWPGSLPARHAVHEARSMNAAVVTTDPGVYAGLRVALLVV